MLNCMQSTSVRVSVETHELIKQLALNFNVTVGSAVDLAVRRLVQHEMGKELGGSLTPEESTWLNSDLS